MYSKFRTLSGAACARFVSEVGARQTDSCVKKVNSGFTLTAYRYKTSNHGPATNIDLERLGLVVQQEELVDGVLKKIPGAYTPQQYLQQLADLTSDIWSRSPTVSENFQGICFGRFVHYRKLVCERKFG